MSSSSPCLEALHACLVGGLYSRWVWQQQRRQSSAERREEACIVAWSGSLYGNSDDALKVLCMCEAVIQVSPEPPEEGEHGRCE